MAFCMLSGGHRETSPSPTIFASGRWRCHSSAITAPVLQRPIQRGTTTRWCVVVVRHRNSPVNAPETGEGDMNIRHTSKSSGASRTFFAFPAFLASAGRRRAALLPAILIGMANLVAGPTPVRAADYVRVLSQNMYVGSDFTALNTAKTVPEFLAAVTTTYQNILARKPEERVVAMAREIAKARPDFVALHEAMILRSGNPPTTVKMDLLQSMLDELAALGEHYALVT